MRKTFILLAALCLLAAVAGTALADTDITVTGSVEALVTADTAVVNLGVRMADRDVLKAQAAVNEAVAAIRDALEADGIPADDINTGFIMIYTSYESGSFGAQEEKYVAQITLSIRTADVALAGRIIDVAFSAGANSLDGISFSASDTEAAKAEALRAAVADAKAKAEVLAEAAGLKIKGIEEIHEGGTYSFDSGLNNFSRETAADAKASGTVIRAAKLTVSASVTVTFGAE